MLIAATLLAGCGSTCENEVSQSVPSPSGIMKAVTYHRGCGATVGFNTQISILPAGGTLPNGAGNVLIADGSIPLALRWKSDTSLQITGKLPAQVFKQENNAAGVRITYVE